MSNLRLYCLFDKSLKIYTGVVLLKENEYRAYFNELVNSPQSPYFYNPYDYNIMMSDGQFDEENGYINSTFNFVQGLDTLIDFHMRKHLLTVQALNFVPVGYQRMPKEEQEKVSERLEQAIKDVAQEEYKLMKEFKPDGSVLASGNTETPESSLSQDDESEVLNV